MKSSGDALAEGFARHRQGGLAAAEEIYRKAISSRPVNVDAFYLLGAALQRSGDMNLAHQHKESAVRDDPAALCACGCAPAGPP